MSSKNQIIVGNVPIGGNAPVAVQTMTKTETPDLTATLAQIKRVAEAGADLVRCAQRCLDLASGRYSALTGRYLELGDDLDTAVREAASSTAAKPAGH